MTHPGARERAFDELFRRPAQPQRPLHQHPTRTINQQQHQQQQSRVQQQQQQQQQYAYQYQHGQAHGQGYYPQHAYPDYPQPAAQGSLAQFGVQAQQPQGGMPQGGRGSVSSYRSSSDAGSLRGASAAATGYFPSSTAGAEMGYATAPYAAQQQQRSYSSAQAYADYAGGAGGQVAGYYPHSQHLQPDVSTPLASAYPSYSSSSPSSSAPLDPSPPPPPPGAARSYVSPRAQYAPTMSSGPASASTSTSGGAGGTSLFSRPSTSSVSSLPYSLPEPSTHGGGGDSPTPSVGAASMATASSAYSTASAPPPRLPEIGGGGSSDDFFGNWEAQAAAAVGAGYADGSWRSSVMLGNGGGGGGQATPTAASYSRKGSGASMPQMAADADGYGNGGGYDERGLAYNDFAAPSAPSLYPSHSGSQSSTPAPSSTLLFDRSRRSSADSDRRSLYQQPYPSQAPSLHPVNASLVSLGHYPSTAATAASASPYTNGGQQYATSSSALLLPRTSSESMRLPSALAAAQGKHNSAGYADHRSLSFSSANGERPDMFRIESGVPSSSSHSHSGGGGAAPYGRGSFAASQPQLPTSTALTPRPASHGSLPPSVSANPSFSSSSAGGNGVAASGGGARPTRAPVVYPALLSRVASAFRDRIPLSERVKDGLVYQSAFDGRDAVDKIAYIIKTSDRNLALLLGRALDAQKFFHDVTYDHRLRDSPNEIYQFRERIAAHLELELAAPEGALAGEMAQSPHEPGSAAARAQAAGLAAAEAARRGSVPSSSATPPSAAAGAAGQEEDELPSGVFTLLTDCYSPTCTRDRLCYSIACPRRLEQQARLNLKREGLTSGLEGAGGLKRTPSVESIAGLREPGSLWIHSVPQEILDATPDREKKRQECINEVFYTERDFVRDMEYLRDFWIKPLRSSNIIPESRREDFVTQVFWNVLEIYAVNVRLAELLNKRQKQAHVVDHIGDIFLDMVPHFAPFVKYGAHQLYGKYEFEKEKGSNPAFAKFVEETERLPESRKLELNGYLTKPTTRLARYPLLLDACLKQTADDNPDKVAIPKVIKLIREFLQKVNVETGKSENRFNLAQLDQQLVFKNGEAVDLRLRDEERELIFKGPLKKRGGTQSESAELQVFLFDHAILMVKQKSKNEQYKVYRKPIPLELLVVAPVDDAATARGGVVRPKSLMARGSSAKALTASAAQPPPGVDKNNKQGFALTFIHLGRRGYQITLWASTWTGRKKWLEKIEERQNELRERSLVFETLPLSAGYFVGTNRLTCAAPFDNGNRMVYGTDNGVYLADLREKNKVPVKVISVPNVTQLDVLEEQGILIVLADKAVQTFFVDHLDPGDAIGAAKRARKISASATFFKAGQCLGRTLVCVVKSGNVSSTIKTLEPIDQPRGGKKQPAIRKFLQGSNESLRVFKEFYIPTESSSVHFLKSKLCVGCTKGFEIVDLETLDTQGLLDPADSSLDFVQKRENAKPIAIYRIEGEFLLCYDEFAFYVNKNGWRAKSNWIIQWEGFPTSFALHYPYVLAFEPTFIEVRHVESGALMQIIPGNNIRCLFADSPPSSSASSSYYSPYHPNSPAARYGSPYGARMPPPPPPSRSAIVVSDGDRAFSLCFNAPLPTDL